MNEFSENERPPLFKTWNHWYMIVLGFMLLQVLLYALLTYSFA